jgi:Ni/Fe-hydrogenase subunit HybB-like protein
MEMEIVIQIFLEHTFVIKLVIIVIANYTNVPILLYVKPMPRNKHSMITMASVIDAVYSTSHAEKGEGN